LNDGEMARTGWIAVVGCLLTTLALRTAGENKNSSGTFNLPADVMVDMTAEKLSKLPRVFAYELDHKYQQDTFEAAKDEKEKINLIFGDEFKLNVSLNDGCNETLFGRNSHQYSLGQIFRYKMKHYPKLVTSPEEADLFYVPYYRVDCPFYGRAEPCTNPTELVKQLPHLNDETAQRHFVVNPRTPDCSCLKTFKYTPGTLEERHGGLSDNSASDLLRSMNKLSLEDVQSSYADSPNPANTYSIPYPSLASGLTMNQIKKLMHVVQTRHSSRKYRVAAFFGPHGMKANLRKTLMLQCANASDCLSTPITLADQDVNTETLGKPKITSDQIAQAYLSSTFCLQPPGDSPSRKGLVDSIVLGCIPVTFDSLQTRLWPWHIPEWNDVAIHLPVDKWLVDTMRILRSIPEDRIKIMRENLAKVTWALAHVHHESDADDDVAEGLNESQHWDAFEVALSHLWSTIRAGRENRKETHLGWTFRFLDYK